MRQVQLVDEGFLQGLLVYPEDGGDNFLRTSGCLRITRIYNSEDRTIHTYSRKNLKFHVLHINIVIIVLTECHGIRNMKLRHNKTAPFRTVNIKIGSTFKQLRNLPDNDYISSKPVVEVTFVKE
jgi:hypothetical protein